MKSSRLEELRIVFYSKPNVRARRTLGDQTFDILSAEGIDMLSVFNAIKHVSNQLGIPTRFRLRDGKPISERQVEERIRKNGRWIPGLQVDGVNLRVGDVTAMEQSFIIVEEIFVSGASSWDRWVSPFLEWPNFVQAWVADAEYDHWQNAADPLQYTTAGRDMTGLKMKSNGLPPPLEQKVVDTSENPGRWEFRQGYVEAIGSVMWFGENFWRLIGSDREDALASIDWLHLTHPQKGILRISSDVYFQDKTTAAQQNALRATLYDI